MTTSNDSSPRARILDKAEELFYSQGYQATGVNQIIEESGVAKASFYTHFPSKEDLCVAYLERVEVKEQQLVQSTLAKKRTPFARYMAVIEVLEPWLIQTNFRGCPFLNIASEITDPQSPIRRVGVQFYRAHHQLVEQIVGELKRSDPTKYSHLDVTDVAQRYMTIFVGAIGLCEVFHSIEPLKNSFRMVRQLVGE